MSNVLSLRLRFASGAPPLRPVHAVWVAAAFVVLWAAWAALFNSAQFGDNVEQFNWAQSLELGYHKHPPLPSWLLGAVILLFGPSVFWAYGLATLCLLATAGFTWLIGRELVGERVAAAAVVLWGLNQTFSQRAQLYNHNTVLVACIAATVWFAMRATRGRGASPLWWAAAGAAAGAALLSKYQALVPLGGLLLALGGSGRLQRPAAWLGLAGAFLVAAAVCAPHVQWVVQHDFTTLRYASEAVESAGPAQRLGFVVSFLANQVRLWFPALLAIGICWVIARRSGAHTGGPAAAPAARPADFSVWMTGLIWSGLLVLMLMALAAGVSLRNHWGVQVLQFFSLWLAWQWDQRSPIDLRRLVLVAALVHAGGFAIYAGEHRDATGLLSARRIDTLYPARRLARAAVDHWRTSTRCPLQYVAGTEFDAGLVALYSGGRLHVFNGAQATPWVLPEDLHRRGALYVLSDTDPVPPGVTRVVDFDLVPGDRQGRPGKTIKLGVMMPEPSCN